jgi:aspartate/methionine/tyrosine aminotransferase
LGDVTVILGERRLRLTMAEAKQLHDELVEHNLAVLALQSELSRAIHADVGEHEIPADDEIRQELLLCLEAIEDELVLTEGLRSLRQAARVPIRHRPEY